ncbi:16S rRNA (N4-methyl-C1402)-methyltransferase [Citrifermentans bemidjiense Bem]|uniref:Ribosomal RNA small subunit methyltransferase H n=1 Tax=Citrifermentans bemidjiense (strain ATCC BAA-1014 / DSM 16622 / JCM 12645 / Bem) TaxID=404380 RepID=RSMH_CITBB|nr:16S rRNA (cytosine(1402)-N(4))-methyltransferase RsmH [Citrifermentans bemidjiense]B5EBP3.1 RecName: Full=Ribosomal RNA small subunit methyltransferase H; AltName: Full=16S rRNA m(4)C1402 methyltransferase; AltName: Full=rRNA (cytosine-N(4)-)-methyltransferase RsmH [Citrifermentans bemidjiense Bem]ACH37512.1 16S rRNA (N4-methyl-C1402)-methyltransferase [Citrifermentans bemidjiense Bem]
MEDFHHISVLPDEVLQALSPRSGGVYVDGTLGGAGHAGLILTASAPDGQLIGFDRDEEAIAVARERLQVFGGRVRIIHRNFAGIAQALAEIGVDGIDGFVLDLGVSSHQLDRDERGFSFMHDAPLDMRMDRSSGQSAADLVNTLPEGELYRIISEYGEERWAKRVASFIVKARDERPIETTLQLVDVIKGSIPKAKWEERLHPATRTFQALRIAVNEELKSLEEGLEGLLSLLKQGGRGAVISFHSLEDRIVKEGFRAAATGCTCPKELPICICGRVPRFKLVTRKPITAGEAEVAANPRSRSAKLRVVEKI